MLGFRRKVLRKGLWVWGFGLWISNLGFRGFVFKVYVLGVIGVGLRLYRVEKMGLLCKAL